MRAIGIVCEYNPFHNGHLHHIKEAKKQSDGEFIVCAMSSNFLQRGEISIIDKYKRAKLAIENGADLVFEIPTLYSCKSAKDYAFNSIELLNKLGICDSIFFGSECNNIKILESIADILIDEPKEYKEILKKHLAKGISFPKARELALIEFTKNDEIKEVISSSNNILGIEYIRAIKELNSPMNYFTTKRVGSSYNKNTIDSSIPSATAIRNSIFTKGVDSIKDFVPASTYSLLKSSSLANNNELYRLIKYKLSSLTESELLKYENVVEGFENRLKKSIDVSTNYEELVDFLSSKRYPRTRIQRLLTHIVLDYKQEFTPKTIKYARLLYSSQKGESLISILYNNSLIPVFTGLKKFYDLAPKSIKILLDFEIKSSNIYSFLNNNTQNNDFTHKFEIL